MQERNYEQVKQELKKANRATVTIFIIGFVSLLILCLTALVLASLSEGNIYGDLQGNITRVANMNLFIIASICIVVMLGFTVFMVYKLFKKYKRREYLKKELMKLKPSLAMEEYYNNPFRKNIVSFQNNRTFTLNYFKKNLEFFFNYNFVLFAFFALTWIITSIIVLINTYKAII